MIIRIEPAGGSFRGAGEYYLHDKAADPDMPRELKPRTDERVWFTDTRNCANFDPELALDEMWHTAENQQWLKAQASGRTSGRRCEDPVKTIAIAWHEEDQPTPEHMIAAADAYLEHMGWQEHQAVYVGHRDTEHRHLHIILNRVHPETGRTLDDYRDYIPSERFGLAYEKEHGKLWCVEREIKAAKREGREPDLSMAQAHPQPANEHIPHNVFDLTKPFEKRFDAAKAALRETLASEQALLKEQQKHERLAFFEDGKRLFRATRVEIYKEVRTEFREQWADFYKQQKATREFAAATVRDALLAAVHFARDGDFASARDSLHDRFAASDDITAKLAADKAVLVAAQKEAVTSRQREATDILMESRKADYEQLLTRQRSERASMRAAHAQGMSAEHVFEPVKEWTTSNDVAQSPRAPSGARQETETARAAAGPEPAQHRDGSKDGPTHTPPDQTQTATQPPQTETAPSHVPQAPAPSNRLEPEPKVPFDLTYGFPQPHQEKPEATAAEDRWQNPDKSTELRPTPPLRERPETARMRDPADGIAGTIGAVADYLADQLSELFAPTPPEVRKANAEQQAAKERKKEAEQESADPWDRYITQATKQIRDEQEKRARDYWTERDKAKDWERDR